MRKSKRYDYILGLIALFIGVVMFSKATTDIINEYRSGMVSSGSPIGFVWIISMIVSAVCIAAGVASIYRGRKKVDKNQ